jgi:hypothetical protein
MISPLIEMKTITEKYNIGEMTTSHDPQKLAEQFDNMLGNKEKLLLYRENLKTASNVLCWENEEKELIAIFKDHA